MSTLILPSIKERFPHLPNLPMGPEHHYPLLIDPLIRKALQNPDPEARKKVREVMSRRLWMPTYAYRPLPTARRFHESQAKYRWCLGGNRSSKSESTAMEEALMLTGTHPYRKHIPNSKSWYCTVTWEMVGSILWEKLERMLIGHDFSVRWRNRAANIPAEVLVRTPLGTNSCVFKAYEQGRKIFQGTERNRVTFDEQFPYDIYTEVVSRIGPDSDLQFNAAMTPIDGQPWLESRLNGILPANWEKFEYPLDDNRISLGGFIPDTEIDALIAEWPEEVQPTRRLGKWGSFLGAVYKTFNRETHVVNEKKERHTFFPGGRIPGAARIVGAIDWGSNNPFVFLWGVQLPHLENEWYIFDEYYWEPRRQGVRLIREHANYINKRSLTWKLKAPGTIHADHDPQDCAEIAQFGINTQPALKSVRPGIEAIQTALKVRPASRRPRLHIAERCENLIRELTGYQYSGGTNSRNADDEPSKVNDHTCDALRYMIYSEEIGGPTPILDLRRLGANRETPSGEVPASVPVMPPISFGRRDLPFR